MPLISLNEAVTWVMGVERRTPEAELEYFGVALAEMCGLAQNCREFFASRADGGMWLKSILGHAFPTNLNPVERWPAQLTWPPQLVLDTLGDRAPDWPPALLTLFEAAERHTVNLSAYLDEHRKALDALLLEGREGRVRFYAQRHRNTRPIQMPQQVLTCELELDGNRRHLVRDPIRAGWRLSSGSGHDVESGDPTSCYYDVKVHAADVAAIVGNAPEGFPDSEPDNTGESNETKLRSPRISDADILAWYRRNKVRLMDLKDQEQVTAIREQFGDIKDLRQRLRDL